MLFVRKLFEQADVLVIVCVQIAVAACTSDALQGVNHNQFCIGMFGQELLGAGREFDMDEVRHGQLSPVFFGSALTNFGVEPFLEEFLRMTPPPLPRVADCGEIDTFDPDFSAFVFKIQANMNKAHRDRLAFMRICSGKFERDREYYHVQGNKKMRLSQPQQLMASEREIVPERRSRRQQKDS